MSVDIKILKDIPLFKDLTKKEITEISRITEEVIYSKDTFLFRQGDEADSFYIILEGEAEVIKVFDGKEQKLAAMSKGAVIGEMAFLTAGKRTGDVKTTAPSKMLKISREGFKKLLEEENIAAYKLVYKIAQILSFRLARLSEQFIDHIPEKDKKEGFFENLKKFFSA